MNNGQIIGDDSETEQVRQATRTMLRSLVDTYDIMYTGLEERMRFVEMLTRETGLCSDVVRFSVLNSHNYPVSHGACRNALLLQTGGEAVVQVDDDILCQLADVPGRGSHVKLTSEFDPTEFWFFPDAHTAINSVRFDQRI